jgi:hypothetical protein
VGEPKNKALKKKKKPKRLDNNSFSGWWRLSRAVGGVSPRLTAKEKEKKKEKERKRKKD